MTTRDGFPQLLDAWLAEDRALTPGDYLGEVLSRTATIRQRPVWLSPGRWLPMDAIITRTSIRPPSGARLVLLAALALLIVASLAIAIIASRPTRPAPFGPAGNGRIGFESNGAIVLANTDGTASVTVNLAGNAASGPTFSRDGTQIAYYARDPISGRGALHVANVDGTGDRAITGNLVLTIDPASPPVWSPDGRQVLFSALDSGFQSLVLANTDGSAPAILVTTYVEEPWYPAWSPDGKSIAFASFPTMGDPPTLRLIQPDGAGERVLYAAVPGDVTIQDLQWAPDDSGRLAFVVGNDSVSRVAVIDVADRSLTTVSERAGIVVFGVAWSPDASRLASNQSDIGSFVVDPDGTGFLVLPEARCAGRVDWSPDGSRILCINSVELGNGKYELLIVDPAGIEPVGHLAFGGDAAGETGAIFSWQRVLPTTP